LQNDVINTFCEMRTAEPNRLHLGIVGGDGKHAFVPTGGRCLSVALPHALSLLLTHTLSHSHTLSLSFTFSLSHALTLSLSHSFSLPPSPSFGDSHGRWWRTLQLVDVLGFRYESVMFSAEMSLVSPISCEKIVGDRTVV
jgi:hypothetical protein